MLRQMERRLSTTEAAQRARMSRERLLRRVQAGEIAGELVIGRWTIFEDSLERFLKRTDGARAPA